MIEKFKRKVLNKFLQIIRQAFVSVVLSDTSEYPTSQVTSNGKATLVTRLSTYGVFGNPPLDSHVLMFQSQGQESTKFGLFNDFLRRKQTEAPGECGLLNTLTGAIVYMKADGSIAIDSPDKSVDISANTEINATAPIVNIIASAEVNVTAAEVNVTASVKAILNSPNIELGDGGAPALEKLLNALALVIYNNHKHPYISPGGPLNTDVPNTLMVVDTDTTKDTKAS